LGRSTLGSTAPQLSAPKPDRQARYEKALRGLLLSPDQVNTVMGTIGPTDWIDAVGEPSLNDED
jgi:hypothetical protein